MKSPAVRLFSSIAVTLLILVVTPIVYFDQIAPQMASTSWPSVPGEVIRTEIEEVSTRRGGSYRPRVYYRYEVDGETFENHQIRAMDQAASYDKAVMRTRAYPVGTAVNVFYNPNDLTYSVLETGLGKPEQLIFLGGGVAVVLLIASWVTTVRAFRVQG